MACRIIVPNQGSNLCKPVPNSIMRKQFEVFLILLDQWLEKGVNNDQFHILTFCETGSRPLRSSNHRVHGLCGVTFLTPVCMGRRTVSCGIQ